MRKNADSRKKVAAIVVIFWCAMAVRAADFAGGTGEPNDPYQIATAEQLISIGSDPNLLDRHFTLVNDIDLDPNLPGGRVFTRAAIAPDTDMAKGFQGIAFVGSLDGNHHMLKNLTIRNDADYLDNDDYLGLFGVLGEPAVVKDLGIEAARVGERYGEFHGILAGWNEGHITDCRVAGRVDGGAHIGGLVGQNRGNIFKCHADGDYVAGHSGVGGLLGSNHFHAWVVKCHATCSVLIQRDGAGGLVGFNEGYITSSRATGHVLAVGYGTSALGGLAGYSGTLGMITDSYAAGSISTWEWGLDSWFGQAGGLVGMVASSSIVNCYATGSVSGSNQSQSIGGLVGRILNGRIVNAYAAGRVSAGGSSGHLGGLVGERMGAPVIAASFWNTEASGLLQSAGGGSLTDEQMRQQASFVGWDFEKTWTICEGRDYPRLRWEGVSCE